MKRGIKTLAWIVLPLALWLFLVLRAMPAEWGIRLAQPSLLMEGVTGTVWQGRVARVLVPYPGGYYSLGSLRWELKPWSLLTLSPCLDFHSELPGQRAQGTACAGLGGQVRLRDTQLQLPAAAAEILAPVRLDGQVDARLESARLVDGAIDELSGQGNWTAARYHNSQTWVDLGAIAFDLREDGDGGLDARVFDVDSPLELDVNSTLQLDGSYQVSGEITTKPDAPQELSQLLRIIATEQSPGQFQVQWSGG